MKSNICYNFKVILLTILYILIVPFLIIFCIPIYIFRFCLSLCGYYFKKDFDKLVNCRSIVLGIDGFPNNPKWNLVVWLTQNKNLDLYKFQNYFENKFIKAIDKDNQLIYPEYQQCIKKWFGYYFWKWDINFNIQNHIKIYNGKYISDRVAEVDDEKLIKIIKELTWAPWNPDRSPWEFIQIPKYKSDDEGEEKLKSILIFRIHHVLGDGYYILKLLMEDISGISLTKAAQPSKINRSLLQNLYFILTFWINGPYTFVQMMLRAKDDNIWHPNELNNIQNANLTKRIPIKDIKYIKNRYRVSFSAVVLAAVTGGMHRTMVKLGLALPQNIHQAVAVPMSGHPRKLRNHFIFSFLPLPIGIEDSIERLQKIEKNLQELKKSPIPLLFFWQVPLVGSLPSFLMKPFTINTITTCQMSNFPGTPELPHFREVEVTDMMFSAQMGPGNTGIGFTIISYIDTIRIFTIVDSKIMKDEKLVKDMNEEILNELEYLRVNKVKEN